MAQNAYDRLDFFTGYSRLPRSIDGLAGAPEWPTLQAMLPNLHKRDVVNPGCGFGWFCRRARQHGAAHILCLELSEKTLESARTPDDAAVTYGDGRPRSALAARCAFRRRQHFARLSRRPTTKANVRCATP